MKKVHNEVYCSRCGDEISPEEMQTLSGSICALCEHMHFEAHEIMAERLAKLGKAMPNSTNPLAANPQ